MNLPRIAAMLAALALGAMPAAAAVIQQQYQIVPGGEYSYLPSPWIGIPGGVPSEYLLDFGIGGTFTYELDTSSTTARLLDLDLVLTGNEAVQAAPPIFGRVTSDRVEAYLASHSFVQDFPGSYLYLESSTQSGLKMTDFLDGSLALSGGYNGTFVDGDGLSFKFSALAVPEPALLALLPAMAVAGLTRRRIEMRSGARNRLPPVDSHLFIGGQK